MSIFQTNFLFKPSRTGMRCKASVPLKYLTNCGQCRRISSDITSEDGVDERSVRELSVDVANLEAMQSNQRDSSSEARGGERMRLAALGMCVGCLPRMLV